MATKNMVRDSSLFQRAKPVLGVLLVATVTILIAALIGTTLLI